MQLNRRTLLSTGAAAGLGLTAGVTNPVWAAGDNEKSEQTIPDTLIIDDFTQVPNATIGGRWSYVSDRVMGGVSDGNGSYETMSGRLGIRLFGDVSTANNGGFIQVSLRLSPRSLDADQYKGLEIDVMGNGEEYNVHVTTTRSFPPWRFYKHSFDTTGSWKRLRLPWEDFTSESFRQPLDPSTINRLNLTAYARNFSADLGVSRIALYR